MKIQNPPNDRWECPRCGLINWVKFDHCHRCGEESPALVGRKLAEDYTSAFRDAIREFFTRHNGRSG